jgi:hypothetical protein
VYTLTYIRNVYITVKPSLYMDSLTRFWYMFLRHVRLPNKIRFRVDFFLIFVASLLCESSWAVGPSAASVVACIGIPVWGSCKCCFVGQFLNMATVLWILTILCESLINFLWKYCILPLSPGLRLNARSSHRVSSLRQDAKIEKFDTKKKFVKQPNMLPKGEQFKIDWYQKHASNLAWLSL